VTADSFGAHRALLQFELVKILLLQLKRIGDLILTTPALAALRENFPDALLTIVVSSECADLLPAVPNVDRTLMTRRNLRDLALFLSVAARRFDCCIDFTRNDRSASLALLSGALRRVVSHRLREKSKMRGRAYTDFVSVRMRDTHTIDYNLALLEPLGVRTSASRTPHLQLPEVAHEQADALRRHWKITRPYIILHPGSARREKLWEPERWAEMIDHFGRNNDIHLVLTSGLSPDEQAHIAAIKNKVQQQIVDLSGRTNLLALAALIGQARLLVTVDSAPMHLAAATRTPQVALFGPTNPFHWRPRESPALILQGKLPAPVTEFSPAAPRVAMSQISTEAVISAMDSLLSLRAAAQSS
jgi:predicted lipopolysaccharide heptosyltransferase III